MKLNRVRADTSDGVSFGVKRFDQTNQNMSPKRGVAGPWDSRADAWGGVARGTASAAPVAGHASNFNRCREGINRSAGGVRAPLLHKIVQRFRGGLVFKAHRHCVSLNSRLESNKEEEGVRAPLALLPSCLRDLLSRRAHTVYYAPFINSHAINFNVLCGTNLVALPP